MKIEQLVKMANEIGNFFKAESDHALAVSGIENHIRKFWEKRMRQQIIEHEKSGGVGLDSLVREAVQKIEA